MGLGKGQTNNPNGRPKGKANKVTQNNREFINQFLENNRVKFKRDWKLLKPVERVAMTEKLYAFVMPKMNSLEIEKLTDDQLDEIFNRLIKQHEQRQV